jgi:leader peptidase (prepilin peptidase)/N-methyltransferase
MSIMHGFYFAFGLAVGSFLNVCIYRIPRGESVALPRSHCPGCGSAIRPYDNVPLLSYLFLRGRCRSCGEHISLQYPAVELVTGLLFYACAAVWSFTPGTFVYSLFLAMLVILVFVDYQHQILPNVVTIPGTIAGILLSPFMADGGYRDVLTVAAASSLQPDGYETLLPWIGSTLGALIGGGILFVVGFAYQLVRKRHGLGMGDVKMMAMVGAFLGWRSALLTIFAASFAGSIVGLFLIFFQGKSLQHKLAFGTFLGIGAAAVLFFGASILGWYTGPH